MCHALYVRTFALSGIIAVELVQFYLALNGLCTVYSNFPGKYFKMLLTHRALGGV